MHDRKAAAPRRGPYVTADHRIAHSIDDLNAGITHAVGELCEECARRTAEITKVTTYRVERVDANRLVLHADDD